MEKQEICECMDGPFGMILNIFVWVLDAFENIVLTPANNESGRSRQTLVRTCDRANPAGSLVLLWPVVKAVIRYTAPDKACVCLR